MFDAAAAARSLRKTRRLAVVVYATQLVYLATRAAPWLVQNQAMRRLTSSAWSFLLISLVVSFLLALWAASVAELAPRLESPASGFAFGSIVAGFVVPVLNFWRPYQIVRALDDAIEPGEIPLVPVATDLLGPQGYRTAVQVEVRATKPAPVKLWWGAYITSAVALPLFGMLVTFTVREAEVPRVALGHVYEAVGVLGLIGVTTRVALTMLVVHRIGSRLEERSRRVTRRADA